MCKKTSHFVGKKSALQSYQHFMTTINNSCLAWNTWFEKLWEKNAILGLKSLTGAASLGGFCGFCVKCWSVTVSTAEEFGPDRDRKPQPRCSLSAVYPKPPILMQIENEDCFLWTCSNYKLNWGLDWSKPQELWVINPGHKILELFG